jgi:SSS family solute:Na+ symporter
MPFAFIFFFAVLWKRVNSPGALACMIAGFVLCPVMMYNNQLKPAQQWFQFLNTPLLTPWLHRAMLVTLFCIILLVGVSLLTAPPPAAKLAGTTVEGLWSQKTSEPRIFILKDYRLWLTIVSLATAVMWFLMR